MKSTGVLVYVLVACLLLLACPAQAAAANPILIVTSSSNPYTTFLPEIIHNEGFNEFDSADISTVSSTTLAAYDLAVLGDMSLTATQATMFSTWVNGGGNLIAMHPDPQLAGLLGLVDTGTTLTNAYVLMNTAGGPGVGLVGQTIQFHGPAELYTLNGATSYATLYSNASTPTTNPAVTLNLVGSGQAAAFTYDLARSVVYTRQGNPAWSGQTRDAANAPPIRAYNLFFGAASFDPEPDWIDFNKVQIPQADEQQRLLANLMMQMNATKKPLPHFWYLPSGFKAAVIMTGDDHGSYYSGSATASRFSDFLAASPSGCTVANWTCVRGTAYLFPNIIATTTLTNSKVATYLSQGFEIGVHVDSATDCQDWTKTQLDTDYSNYLASFASQFPSLPAPQTHRMHCISWSDYDSQPTIELKHGIRLDTSYYYWPASWINDLPGMFTGSGMPMRYADRNGNVINVYQAVTQMTDESGQSYPLNINTLLDNAVSGSAYYGVFTANMHNDGGDYPGPGAAFIVSSAQARGVPVITSLQMLQWLDGRNGSSFNSLSWSGNVLSFSVSVGTNANNLRAMLPVNFGSLGLSSILLGSSSVSYQLQVIKGVQYAVFAASAGSYTATYGGAPLFSISGAVIPGAVASGTTITATGPVTVSASADNYGNYFLNGLPSGTYTVTPSKSGVNFTPSTQTVTVSGGNVTAVNFDLVETCPCSLWNTSVSPGNPAEDDPSAIEVGVAFRSDAAGSITGIRFYKGSGNTGTHVANLWTTAGTKLGTATFANETASGWQQVNFTTPVAITANTVYIASYHTTKGYYAADDGYFSTSYDNAPLHAVQDGVGNSNGVYHYGSSGFPNNSYGSSNYWVDVVFSPTTTTYSISGTVSGPGGSGATVSLTGTATATTTADTSGNYSFNNLKNGSYTVAPTKSGFTFTPANQPVTISNANVTGLNFSTVTYGISGNVSGSGGSGATVNLSGTATASTTADTSGNFSFTGLANGSYSVAPSKSGFTFTPANQPVTISNGNMTGVSFSTVTYTLSGTITGPGASGATVNLTGAATATTTANGSGSYTFSGLTNGSYTVTPSNPGYNFTPSSQGVTVSNGNATVSNFSSAAVPTYSISGNIGGAGGSTATVTLSGSASASTTADTSGNYSFPTVAAGSYTVTPSKTGYNFTPASQPVTVTNNNVSGVNFSTAVQSYTLQGTISGPGGPSATVTLSGTSGGTTSADSSGNFTFNALINGPYTVTPSNTGFTFSPGSQGVTISNANVTGMSFSSFANCPCSLWPNTTVPGTVSANDPNQVELGVRFTSDAAGYITGIRFYKGSTNTGTHIGNLWSNTGTLLATATFTNETASGWQQVTFASPVAISANTTYVASYNTTAGNYSYDQNYFTSQYNNPPLHGVQDGSSSGSNGIYGYGASAFPTGTYLSTNYYVDVVFATAITAPTLSSVTLNPTSVAGGASSTGTVTLTGAATGTGATVSLSSNNAAATVPTSVTVPSGATTATFTVSTTNVTTTATATISATYNSATQTAGLTVNPLVVSSVTLNPTSVTGGTSSSGTVTLNGAAPSTGATVSLSSNNAAATVPTSVNVASGATTATFTVATTPVASVATATISGTYNSATQTAGLTVNPPVVSSVTLNPTSVTGGTSSSGTVTLSGPAPSTGATVGLSSNNAAATVPTSVSVASGATTTTFTVNTTTVTTTATATISASLNGGTQTAPLTINPSSGTTFSISGTISGSGGNGATVTLSGTASATVTASTTGTYTFSNLANGSYTVTPSKTGYIFTPANTAVTVNGANMTANFTSTAQLAIDKTASTDRSTNATTIASPSFTTASTNELLLAFISTDATKSGITVSGVTGGSLTWTLVKRTNTQLGTSEIWRAFAPAVLSNATVTATLSQSVAASITVVTFTGADTTGTGGSGAIGATGTGNSSKGAPTASLTTTRNNSWVFGVGNDYDNATSRTVGANQTMVHQYLATTGDTYWVQRQTNTTPTSGTAVTINDTAPTGDRYNLSTCEVLPAQ